MANPSFDPEKLYVQLDQRRRQERRSFRSIARDLHISQSTFTRLGRGMSLDANTLVRLMGWLGVADIRQFTATDNDEVS